MDPGYLRALFERFPMGILLANDRGTYVDANPAACRILGRSRDEVVGRSVGEIVRQSRTAAVDVQWQSFRRDGAQSGAFELLLPDGSPRWVHFHAYTDFVPGLHCSILTAIDAPTAAASGEGLLTLCAWTKRILVDGAWIPLEKYLADHHGVTVTHGICPDAMERMLRESEGG